jgi:hypothetical protein
MHADISDSVKKHRTIKEGAQRPCGSQASDQVSSHRLHPSPKVPKGIALRPQNVIANLSFDIGGRWLHAPPAKDQVSRQQHRMRHLAGKAVPSDYLYPKYRRLDATVALKPAPVRTAIGAAKTSDHRTSHARLSAKAPGGDAGRYCRPRGRRPQ